MCGAENQIYHLLDDDWMNLRVMPLTDSCFILDEKGSHNGQGSNFPQNNKPGKKGELIKSK